MVNLFGEQLAKVVEAARGNGNYLAGCYNLMI